MLGEQAPAQASRPSGEPTKAVSNFVVLVVGIAHVVVVVVLATFGFRENFLFLVTRCGRKRRYSPKGCRLRLGEALGVWIQRDNAGRRRGDSTLRLWRDKSKFRHTGIGRHALRLRLQGRVRLALDARGTTAGMDSRSASPVADMDCN